MSFLLQGRPPPLRLPDDRGRAWRGGSGIGSAPAPPARPARSWASLVRLREPRTRSSHDGGCSRRRRTRGARWGRRARGRRGPGANVSLCVSPFPSSPSGAPGRRAQQEGLDDGPDFLSEEDRGVSCAFRRVGAPLLPRRGLRRGPGCCAAARRRPRDPGGARPALLQPFFPGVVRFSVPLARLGRAIQPCAEPALPRPRCRWGGQGAGRLGTPPFPVVLSEPLGGFLESPFLFSLLNGMDLV